jgi:predicted Zn-dependent protease
MTAGYNNFFKGLKWPVLLAVSLLANNVVAQLIVTPGTAASGSLCVGDDYVDVGDIEVVENVPNALGNGTFTYILTPPTNFEFDPTSGSVSVLQESDQLSNVSVTRGSATFTIEYTHNDDGSTLDGFRIEGLKIKATGADGPSLITANNGTSPASNGQDHGTFSSVQVVANAGDDVTICEGNSTVVGGTPAATGGDENYTYLWTPTPELSDATAPNPTATPAASVTYTLTVTDGTGCSGADQVDITVNPKPVITVQPANAEICEGGDAVFTVTATGTNLAYQWYDDGNPVGGNSNELTLSSVGLADNGSNIHVVVTETGADPNCQVSSSTAVLTVYDTPTASNAGPDITQCNTEVFTMAANVPVVGSGSWGIVGADPGVTITNTGSATTTVTGLTAGSSVTLRWTISNGPVCGTQTDDVVLTNDIQPIADAGSGGNVCGIGVANPFTFTGVSSTGSGLWTYSGPGNATFTDNTSAMSSVTVDAYGSYTFTWTETNGTCSDFDEVAVEFWESPVFTSAGADITQCNTGVFTMGATAPTVGTGTWSEAGGPTAGLVITNVNSATTTVTGLTAGSSVTLRWTISNGPVCGTQTDDVVLTNDIQPIADAGSGGNVCGIGVANPFTFTGVSSTGSGLWTYSGPGNATFTDNTSAMSSVTVDAYGSYTFTWTETNGTCSDFDEVSVEFWESPVFTSAGADITQCNTGVFTMGATAPAVGTGTWSEVGGPTAGLVITNVNSATTTVTGLAAGSSANLRWTISNGACTASTDDVVLSNEVQPVAEAGPGGDQCGIGPTNLFSLGATAAIGTGTWSKTSGDGIVTFSNVNDESATVWVDTEGSYTLAWTDVNGLCSDSDEVTINFYDTPTASNAGPDITQCNTEVFTMAANVPVVGSGSWGIVGADPGVTITNTGSATTTVTGLTAGNTVTLRWTISNGACTASTDDVVLSNEVQPVAEAGPGGDQCGIGPTNLFSLGATAAIGTGTWSKTSGDGIVTFSNVNDESATVWVDTEGSYTLAWTDVNGLCSDSDEVTINFYDTPTASNAGPDITQCNTEVFTMAANVPVVGSGSWGIVGADPGVTITNTGSATTTVTGLTAGNTVTLRWTISNGACTASTDDVVLSNEVQPVAEAGPGGDQCGIGPTNLFSLGATAAIGTGTWSKTSGDGIVTFSNVNDESATVWVDTEGSYTLAWTDVNGLCSDSDEVTINFYDTPTASNAGPDITQCNTEVFTMAANVPVVGSGTWSEVGGPTAGLVITNVNSATTTVTGLAAGSSANLRWTISNGACTASTDDVVLSNEVQPVAEAGPGGDQCGIGPTNLFSLGATAAIGTGTWSKTSGDGIVTFSNVNDESATVWVDTEGSYTLAWTDVNGLCSDSDEVMINFYDTPTASNAGPDITQCNTEVFTMAANVPVVGSGSWGIVGADPGVTITNTGSATTTVTGLTAGNTVTLRWTISNGACTASTDDVVLSNEVQPVAEAGPGGDQCGIGPTNLFSLGATAAIGTGTWSKTSGDGIVTFSNVNDESATVWVDTEGSYTLAWTDVNGLCSDSDEVTINFYDTPTASNAGPDITQCNTEVFTMAANVPVVGSGSWGIVGADPGVTITNTGSATTTVTGLTAGNTVTLRWTISNGACTASTDDVVLSNEVQPVAEAGPGGDQCGIGPTNLFSLGATAAIGTGTWSKTSGDGIVTFSNVNDESATVWVDTEGSYTLAWTDVNGLCSDSDEVTINFYDTPTASNAGPDITQCNTEVFTMAANVPVVGSGTWSEVGGPTAGLVITNVNSATTTVTGLAAGSSANLRWTISNGACTASTDDVVLSNEVQPVAEAGPGGDQCGIGPTNLFSLGATAAIGTGTWSKTSGDGIVTFSNVNDESATVWVDTEGSYTLAWTDVNGLCSDSDEVMINFYDTPTASNAGPDITQCNTEVFTMAANVPVVGSGSWGIVGADPGVTITNTGSATTTVTGLTAGNTVTLRWTISNGACTASTDDVVLSNEVQPVAEAGPGGGQCGIGPTNLFSLGATAAIGTGTWSKTSGDGIVTFSNVNDESATVWVDTEGSYTLAWTDVNGLCSDSDEVTINFYDTPTASNAGPDITQCNTEVFTMAANVPVVGSGSWGIVGADPGVTITNTGSATTTVTGLTAGNTVTLRWTISNGACTASTDDVVLSNEVQPVAEAGPGGDQCGIGPTNLFSLGATAAIGTGTWSKTSGDGIVTFSNVNDESATVWVDTEGSYTLAWTDVNGLCSDSDEVTINFYDTPTASNAGPDITQCNTEVFTMAANVPVVGSGTWSEVGGPTAGLVITNVNSATTTVTGLAAGSSANLRWTISNGACTASTDDVVLSNEVQPVAEAGPGGDQCGIGPTNLFSLGATAAIGTGTWSKTSGDGIVTFSNVNDESATVWVDTEGSYTLAWTDVNGLCSDSDEVTINFYDTPTASNAGPDITQCNTEVFTMAANVPVVGSGSWGIVGADPGVTITNTGSATTTVTGLTAGNTVTLRWTISNGACTASTDDVVLSNEVQPVAEAGPGGGQCGIGPTNLFSLGATAAIGTGTWSKTSGDGIVTFSNVNDESATVWVDTEGSYTLAWTDVNGLCSDSDEVTINFYDTPTASNAGPDITQCNTEVFTMAANVPVVGSGSWGIVGADPGVTITNTGSATTTVTGLTAGNTVTLRWTISNGACTASTDDVVLSNEVQPVAEAGPGGDQCGIGPTNLFSLGATAAIGTGTWSKTSGDGIVTFSNVNDESATVWVDTEGSYTLAWTDVNGLCSDSDEVTINFYDTPTASNAGPDITQCNTEVFTMAANVPVVGSGSWGIVGADPGVTITNTGSATTTVTGLTAGNTVTLRWTISNGACTASTDDVVLSNEVQPVAEAGPGGDQCGIGPTNLFSLGATAAIGTGTWSKTSGDGIVTFSNVNDESATVWVDTEGSYTLAWIDVNGLCSDSDEVTINFYDTPTASNAGPDITQCNTEVFTMAANVPVVGSGSWGIVGADPGVTITNTGSATTTVTGLTAGNTVTLRWTISNGACTASTDDVVLSNEVQPVAEAGPGGDQCGIGPTNLFSLGATAAIGTGTWSKTSGDGIVTFSNVNDESATVWVDTEGSYTLAWTDVNGLCSDSDEVTINFYDTPTASNAGPDITQCNTEVFTMAANVPVVGSGSWGIVGADPGVTITNTGSATTTVTGLTAGNTVTLRWTISNGACTASTDDVVLSNEVQPVAEAGPGGDQCGIGPTNLFSLGATAAIGTGTWSKTSGDGIVTFSNVNDESATVWVDTEGSYTLAWTDVNGLCSDSDEVTINFYDTPTASNAGPDITQCNTEVFTMAANVPVVGSGSWGIVGADPGVTITNTGSATTTVTGLTAGNTVTLRWTISNGACTASTDDVVLSNEVQPVAEAGPGGDQCGIGPTNLFSLGATAAIGTGTWSKTSGDGIVTFSNVNDESATVWVDTEGSYTLAWTDVNGLCSDSDEVTINFYDTPTASNAGPDITQCNTEVFTMAANVPVVGSGSWGIVGADPGVTITNTGSATTTVTGLTAGNTVTLRWTISNGACTASTDDVVLSNEVQPAADAGTGGSECDLDFQFSASLSTAGTGVWSKVSGPAGESYDDATLENAVVTVTSYGRYVFRWTETNGGCSDSDEVTVTFSQAAELDPGAPAEVCSGISYTVTDASANHTNEILWTHDGSGALVDATTISPTYTPAVADAGNTVVLTLTATGNGACPDVIVTKDLAVTASVIVDAGSNEEICEVTDVEQVFDFSLRSTQASSSNDNGTYNWVADPVVSGSFNDNTILNPTFEIVLGYNGTITFTLTAGGEGSCGDGVDSFVLLVRPTPSFSVTSHISNPTTINSGELTDIQISTTSGFVKLIQVIKSDNGLTGNSPINTLYQDGFTIQDVLENSTDIQQDIQYIFEAFDGSCTNPDKDTARVYVNPAPEFEVINTRPILCPSELTDITVDSETSGAVITLLDSIVSPNPNGITGMTSTGTSWSAVTSGLPFNITDGLVNSTDTIQTVRYIFEVNASGLTATKFTEVAVNPLPDFQLTLNDPFDSINSGTSTLILINTTTQNGVVVLDSIRKTGNILGNTTPGVTFVDGDQITDNLTNGTNSPQTITYYFSARANGCINAIDIDSAKVVVIPAPELVITNNQPEVCPINKTDIDLYSPTADAEVELINITISPDATGVSNFSPIGTIWAGGPTELVAKIADSLINSSDVIKTITYDLRISANGFTATTNKTVSVEIRPNPQMSLSNNNPNILSNTSTDIFINTPTENGQVELSAIDKDERILGNTSAGVAFTNGNQINDILVNNSDTILSISYIFRATANTCINPDTDTVSVTVNPIPNFTITNALPILCTEQQSNFEVTSPTANAEISLTAVQIAPNPSGVTGFTTPATWTGDGSGLVLEFKDLLENLTDTIQTVTYEFDIEANGFDGTETKTVSVEVNPLPRQVITNNQPVVNVDTKTDILISTRTENGGVLLLDVIKDAGILGNTSSGVVFSDSDRIEDELVNQTDNVLTIKYVFKATANGCENSETDMAIVEVNPNPRLTIANNKPIICSGETVDIQINSPTAGATIRLVSATAVPDAGSVVGLTPDNFTWNTFPATISDELSQTTNVIQRVEYLFEVSVPGYANPVLQSAVVDVKPLPDISASGPEICSGGVTSVDIGNPNSVSFTVFNWTVSDTNGNIEGEAPGTGNRITQVLDNTTALLDSVIYRIYATAQLCAGDSIDVVQRVYPQNVAIAGTDTVVCQGTPAITIETANIAGGSTAASWSKITGGGTLTDETTLTPTYAPDPIDEVGTITLELTASNASVCPPVTDLVSIIINSKPTVEAGSNQTICEGSTALMSEAMIGGSAASVTWSDPSGKGSFLPNNATLNAIFEPHPDQVGTTVKLYVETNDPSGPCVSAIDSLYITINDAPEVSAGADQTICEGDVAVMSDATIGGGTSSVTWSGGAGTWDDVHKLDATYTPDASEIGEVVILTITTDDPDGPCTAISDQIRVAVNKAPEVYAGTDQIVCEGETVLIGDATSGGSTTSVLWTGGTGTFSPNNTTLNTTYIHAAGEVNSTVTLTITTNDPDGPCVAVSDQIDITINDAPEVFAGADQTICEGDVAVMSDATYGGGTSSITWSGGAGTWDDVHKLDATYTPDASEIGSVVILTITTDDPAGPCTAISDQIRVAVNKAPEVFAGVDKVICEGDQVLINDATSGGSTTSVLWTGGTGTFSPNNTTLNTTYIHAAGEVNSTVTLTITTNDPDGPCVAVSDQIDITINDAPEVFAGADQTICEGDVAVMSDATYGGGTSSITWSGGAGTWDDVHKLDATYTPDASEIGSVVILTITTDDPDGPCAAISDQIRVAVNKAPEVFAGVDKVICEGDQVLINDATSGGSTTSVLWTGGTGTFSPNNTTLNTTYSHAAGEVNSTVTLTITTNDPDGPCVAVTDEVNITIDEAPTVDAGVYAPVCIGDAVQLNGLLGGSASSATWTGGVGEFDPDRNSTNARYIADESEQGGRVLLTLTTNDPDGVCVASSATTEIVVNRLPSPKIFFLKDAYQIDDAPETLVGEPSPGIFDGPGMFESTFIPAVADIGVHTITYTHTDGNGCTNFVSQETEVFPLPESEVGNPDPYCLGVNPTDFPLPRTSNTDELEDSWFGDNVFQAGDDYYFNNVAAGVGLHAIDYIVVNRSTGARDTLPRSATVYDVAKVNFTNINKCIADSIQFVDLSVLEDADVFGDEIESWIWEFGKGSNLRVSEEQNPKILFDENEPDNYFVKLEVVTKLGQCASDFAKDTIKVGAIPDADFFVSNLTSGELAQFSDSTKVPNPRYISGSFIDPTTSIDSIWWDFGEPPAQFGAYQIYKDVEHEFSEPKEYNVKMVVKTNLGCKDTVTRSISILQVISTFPHITDFDTPPINDQAHRPDTSSWRLMVPDGSIIKGTSRAWVTSDEATGRHKDSEHSFVALDAYDLRSLVRPMFTMDVWSNAESTRDGALLQYSFNGSQWFTMIDEEAVEKVDYPAGQIGLNWYNEKGLVSRPGDGTIEGISGVGENEFAAGWTGIYDSWRTARFPLDDIRTELIEDNHISVRFRVVFASDEQNPEGTDYDGFAFDNIIVSDRTHNVIIEHFDNLSIGNQINLMNETTERFSLDMIPLQYHTNYPQADVIYLNNKFPVETRGSIYDISQSPRAFMDGISEYNFTSATIEKYQIVNRSMIDPVFDIQLTPEKIAPNTVTMNVTITAQTAFDEEVTLYTVPIETSITRLDELNDLNIDSLNNIVKDLLPSGGLLIDQTWEVNDTYSTQLVWDLNQLNEGNEIYDTTKLGVIVFVQNAANEGSREIYQAIFEKLPVIQPTPITGLDDDLNARRIAEAEIYPNPADQHFNVALSGKLTSDVAWVIVDQRGIELQNGVFDKGEDLYQVDAAALPAGLHMMIFSSSEDHRVIRKIIINR